ncbi:MAG: DNA-3-methyladenine glycosylase family protein [Actinomycetota bacterium]
MARDSYDVALIRNGHGDPTTRVVTATHDQRCESPIEPSVITRIERASLTPEGAGTVAIELLSTGDHHTQCWGPGGRWLAQRALRLLARSTDFCPIRAVHPAVHTALRDVGQLHLPATDTPYHEALPAVLGQRITAAQALSQWASLCRRYGDIAPGPLALRLPPTPDRLLAIPSWEFHRLGIEEQRARTLRCIARHHRHVESVRALDGAAARSALMQLPGIGIWTAAVTVGVSHGDADALPIGDFHVKHTVAWALAGKPRGTDDEMLTSLTPYQGQRWQVVRLLERAGFGAPRRGPRRRLLDVARL